MFEHIVSRVEYYIWSWGIPVGDEQIPFLAIALLGTGFFLTLRLGFIQLRRLGHGFAVTSGKYDDPNEPGDVSHFQALTTALSATVGIGNIAGVALAIHLGGPGALFWMWVTAFLGMALKYSEVTLAQKYRQIQAPDAGAKAWDGSVSGGPMYYMEKGLGWKPVAIFFSCALMLTSFLTGNGVQANTIADNLAEIGIPPWGGGLISVAIVAAVILGGIKRIGRVTSILAPLMAVIYVAGALLILLLNVGDLPAAFSTIVKEAFNPTAGVAGTGTGAFIVTMMWGIRRGLFSNEAGQGSAPIAHAAAQTDEPVSEGVVALLEPFIDTIIICTMTGLVIVTTGVWHDRIPTALTLGGGDSSYVRVEDGGLHSVSDSERPAEIRIEDGQQPASGVVFAWHEAPVESFYADKEHTRPFSGVLVPAERKAVADDGTEYATLYGLAAENGAPLTKEAFTRGLAPLGGWGGWIVFVSVLLFGISTAISWSYYGDRCANYLFGPKAILPYKILFCVMHYVGAVVPLATIWVIGDIALGLVTFPNLVAVIMLSGVLVKITKSYFERQPWRENEEAHKRWKEEHRRK